MKTNSGVLIIFAVLAGCSAASRNLVAPDAGTGSGGTSGQTGSGGGAGNTGGTHAPDAGTGSGGTLGQAGSGGGAGNTGGTHGTGTCDPTALTGGTYHACLGGSVCYYTAICLCPAPYQIFCDAGCVDSTTTQNCGGCGITCGAGQSCTKGSCTSADAGSTMGTADASGSGGHGGGDAGAPLSCGDRDNPPFCLTFAGTPLRAIGCSLGSCRVLPGGFGMLGPNLCTCVFDNGGNEGICPVGFLCETP